jgi:aromatic ring-cleaving dioxygenase
MVPTPECSKMLEVHPKSQIIGAFLEWLEKHGMEICRRATKEDERDEEGEETMINEGDLLPTHKNIEKILAEYFNIDLNKADAEKRAILEEIKRKDP